MSSSLTKFSQFNTGGSLKAGDIVVGLRGGVNTQFFAPALPALPWQTLTIGQPLLINEGAFIVNSVPQNFLLPTTAIVGEILQIVNFSGIQFSITQAASQQIQFGSASTTVGVGGSITSTAIGDSITLICNLTNLGFVVLGAPMGNWIVT